MTVQILNLNASFDHTGILKHKTESNVVRVDEVVALSSGKGIDVARVLNTLKFNDYQVNNIVGGAVGEIIIRGLEKEGINSWNYKIEGDSRINYALVDEFKDEFLMINEQGPLITEEEKQNYFKELEDWLIEDGVLVLAGSATRGFKGDDIQRILKTAISKNMYITVDISKQYLKASLEEKLDVLKINEKEFSTAYKDKYHLSFNNKKDYIKVAREENFEKLIITFGEEGALYYSDQNIYWGTHTKKYSNYAIGSGDSFFAGYIYGFMSDYEEIESFRLALACGVANTRMYGASRLKIEHINEIKDNHLKIERW